MDDIGSTEFRKTYATLANPARVTSLGRTVGYWVPSTDFAIDQIDGLRKALVDDFIRGRLDDTPELDHTLTMLQAKAADLKARAEPVVTPDGISFGQSRPAPKPGHK